MAAVFTAISLAFVLAACNNVYDDQDAIYNVSAHLSNPKADDNAKRLMKFLADNYGKMVITGQYGEVDSDVFKGLQKLTGSYPAIMGLDFMDYSPSRIEPYFDPIDYFQYPDEYMAEINQRLPTFIHDDSVKWDAMGGIVSIVWHWNAPAGLINTEEWPWYKGFYTSATTFNLKNAMANPNSNDYKLLVRDIDIISDQLKALCDAGIPVLWRPLHEGGGNGWFWWDAYGGDAYIALWRLMYDRMVNDHNLTNLIWVWNGGGEDYYPGDEYVDIAGLDMYPGYRDYSSQHKNFRDIANFFINRGNRMPKIIGIMEDGVVPDIDQMVADNAMWSMFITWTIFSVNTNGDLVVADGSTETSMVKKTYTHEKAYTLNNLPDLKNYPLN